MAKQKFEPTQKDIDFAKSEAISKIKAKYKAYSPKELPEEIGTGIYIVFKGLEIIYIGQSVHVCKRLKSHKIQMDYAYIVPVNDEIFKMNCLITKGTLISKIESALVSIFKPKYNKLIYNLRPSYVLTALAFLSKN